jgi:hypothetical protein
MEKELYTDCKGAMAAVNKRNRDVNMSLGGWAIPEGIEIRKIKAHPERREGEWDNGEKGIFFADQVAGGEGGKLPSVTASGIIERVSRRGILSVVDESGVPFMGNLRRRCSKKKIVRYLERRDKYREGRGRVGIWGGASLQLIHKMLGKNRSMEDRAASLRIGAQKRWALSDFNKEVCGACGIGNRSSKHALLRCGDSRMRVMRRAWMGEVSKRIGKIRNRDVRGAVEELWTKMKNNEGGEYAMCGVFQVRLLDILYRGEMEIRDGEDRTIMKILRKIGEGAREMIRLYVEIKGVETAARELRQTNIVGFYGRGGKGIDMPRVMRNSAGNHQRGNRGKKRKKRKSTVVLRKGGFVNIGDEGGNVRWDFIGG